MFTMRSTCVCTLVALLWSAPKLEAATIFVAAGGNLQQALNDARPGDTILLQENAEFVGNFVLPAKTGDAWIILRSAAPDTALPGSGVRIRPSHAPLLARLRSPNSSAALRTAPGAHHWDIRYIEFPANQGGLGDIVQLGDGSSAQNSLAQVPHHIVLDHVYVHGDPLFGQKRGIALNAANVTISDSHISDCKGVGQDTQAIGGWNGPGPFLDREQLSRSRRREHADRRQRSGDRQSRRGRRDRSRQLLLAADVVAAAARGDAAGRDRRGDGQWVAARRYLRLSRRRPPPARVRVDCAVHAPRPKRR